MVAAAAAMFIAGAASAVACAPPPGAALAETERYRVALAAEPAEIAVGAFFAVVVEVCAKPGAPAAESVDMDAHMPAHRHGMNYAPKIERLSATRFRATGLLFHMPGRWEFLVDIRAAGRGERAALARLVE
jgi:hypothetical protein